MRPLFAAIVALAMVPIVGATHDQGCVIASADPNTYLTIDAVVDLDGDGLQEIFYQEERDTGLPPVPLTGMARGNGSFTWEESHDYPGLQRRDWPGWGDWFPPGCDQDWGPIADLSDPTNPAVYPENLPEHVPCLIINEDPIFDEVCGHGQFWDEIII